MSDLELKKYCVEKTHKLEDAIKLYAWLRLGDDRPELTMSQQTVLTPKERIWIPQKLTKIQKAFLQIAIQMHLKGEKITGVAVGAVAKCSGQNASTHLANLRAKGYIRRMGNKWIPLRGVDGLELPVIKTVLPTMPAKGYKPLTAPMGKIARVKV